MIPPKLESQKGIVYFGNSKPIDIYVVLAAENVNHKQNSKIIKWHNNH